MEASLSDKKIVQVIVQQCKLHGIEEVVVSPGSRNAPLVISFNNIEEINCFTIVDERSAGFFALGLAQQLKRPVALCCTSGSAALNYAPAVVEAFYQEIPLVVFTADRPIEWLGQADGQTIPQNGLFQNYIRFQASMPVDGQHSDDEWYARRVMSEALIKCMNPVCGPVHINVPLREPLYGKSSLSVNSEKYIRQLQPKQYLSHEQLDSLEHKWQHAAKVMVICGVMPTDLRLNDSINHLARNKNTVVLTETTSNLHGQEIVKCIDRQIFSLSPEEAQDFQPDILISFGGQIVSKQIKKYLRDNPPKEHWHISLNENVIDTFQHLSLAIKMNPDDFFAQIAERIDVKEGTYKDIWSEKVIKTRKAHEDYLNAQKWSDIKVMEYIFKNIPHHAKIQLANSTPVRYAQLFQDEIFQSTFSNRGTSGIDGSLSTAVGASQVSYEPTVLITGDLSFFYDSNGLWNKYLKQDFKIILINNGGGGIFRFIPGPAEADELEEFFEAKHQQSAEYIAKAFGLNYYTCSDVNGLEKEFSSFINENNKASLIEIFTPGDENGHILRNYFKNLRGL